MAKKNDELSIEDSSGNIFADIGLPNPDQEELKAKLKLHIYRIIKSRKLTQVEAGGILGIKQPHVSALMRNRTGNFSIGRLMHFLTALGQDVEISVKPAPKRRGHGELLVYVQWDRHAYLNCTLDSLSRWFES